MKNSATTLPTKNGRWYEFRNASPKVAEINIMDEIGGWGVSARQLCAQIRALPEDATIQMHIFSAGGDVMDGNEIYNTLKEHKGRIEVTIGALCASIATVIASAGTEISIAKNGLFMIHNPWTYAMGEAEDLRVLANLLDKMKANIIDSYVSRNPAALDAMRVAAMMNEETWMTAEEALTNGFVNKILTHDDPEGATLSNRIDIKRFKNSAALLSRLPKQKVQPSPAPVGSEDATNAASGENQNQPSLLEQYNKGQMKIFALSNSAAPLGTAGQPLIGRIYNNTPPAPSEKEINDRVAAEARKLLKAKLDRDKEIDDMVLAIRDRDKKDFSALAAEFKQQDKSPDEFARAVISSDKFKVHSAVGEGEDEHSHVEVLGVRGLPKGSPGEVFVASAEYRDLVDKLRTGKKARGTAMVMTRDFAQAFRNVTTSTGLTSIEKLPGVVTLGVRPLTIKDLIAPGSTSNTTIRYIREVSFQNYADVVAEGSTKPAASFSLEEVDSPVRKIAAYTKVTDELWADFLAVASYINMRLPYMVERTEEDELLNGNGTGQHLTGILTTAGIQTQAKGGDTVADAIYKSFTKVRWGNLAGTAQGGFEPDGIVIHPTDWEELRLTKDANGQYFAGGPFTGAYGNGSVVQFEMLWGKPVVITPAIAEGTALTGAFRLASQYFQRQGLVIESTNTNEDDFIKNLTTIRAEERLALAVYRPAAFCQVTGI